MGKLKASGERGSWFATVNGKQLPCVHEHWWQPATRGYLDPGAKPGQRIWDEYIDALKREKRAILTKDKVSKDEKSFERIGYTALFEIDQVEVTAAGLQFIFVKRIAELE
jgi:hypothetical protein